MSRDNPTPRPTETDKPTPAASVPADGGSKEPRPLAEPRSQAQHAADVHSRPPIRRFEPASPSGSSTPSGGSHGPEPRTPPSTDRTGTGTGDRPHGQNPGTGEHRDGRRSGTPGSGAGPSPEVAGSQGGPVARAPGTSTGFPRDQGSRPIPETTRPRDLGGRAPGSELPGSGRQLAEPRSQAQFAKDVMSRPPIRRFEPATPTASPDTSGSPASRAPETGSATRQRPARETTQQASIPARERPASETSTETSTTRQPDAEPTRTDRPPAPQRPASDTAHHAVAADTDPSPPADAHAVHDTIAPPAETGNNRTADRPQHTPEMTGNVGPHPADSGTRPAHATSETSENPNPPAAERPAASAAPATAQEVGGREPASASSPEAQPAQASTTEHDPQPQNPDPDAEATASPDGNAQQGETKHLVLHITSQFHDQKLGMYTDGTNWMSDEAVRAAAKKDGQDGQSPAPERHGITDFPQQRDLGNNEIGENPDVHLGDTSDQRTFADKMRGEAPFAQNLGEKDDPSEKKLDSLLDKAVEGGDDLHDGIGGFGEAIGDILARGPVPPGTHTLHSGHPGYEAQPSHGLNVNDMVGGTVLLIAAAAAGARHTIESHRRDH